MIFTKGDLKEVKDEVSKYKVCLLFSLQLLLCKLF